MKKCIPTGSIGLLLLPLAACNPQDKRPPVATDRGPIQFELKAAGLPHEGNWKCDPLLVDVNGDGHLDLVLHPRLGRGPRIWLGDGAGGWRESSEGLMFNDKSCGGVPAVADVNKDGKPDLLVADHCGGLFVFLGDGKGGWQMVTSYLPVVEVRGDAVPGGEVEKAGQGAECLAVGDVNEDGLLDIVVGSSDVKGISVFLGDGTGRNWARQAPRGLPEDGWVQRVRLADMNKDGHLDVVASHSRGPRVFLGDGKASWKAASDGLPTPSFGGLFQGLVVADLNEDGRPDFAVSNWIDGPEVYLQQADGSWKKTPDTFPQMQGGAYGLALADIDRDGHLDMLVSGRLTQQVGYVYGVFFLRGDGQGAFKYVPDSRLPTSLLAFTWGLGVGDFNEDGVPDVVAGSGGTVATDNTGRREPAIAERILPWQTVLERGPARVAGDTRKP